MHSTTKLYSSADICLLVLRESFCVCSTFAHSWYFTRCLPRSSDKTNHRIVSLGIGESEMIASRRARALFFMYACETSSIVLGFHPTVRLRGIAIRRSTSSLWNQSGGVGRCWRRRSSRKKDLLISKGGAMDFDPKASNRLVEERED